MILIASKVKTKQYSKVDFVHDFHKKKLSYEYKKTTSYASVTST